MTTYTAKRTALARHEFETMLVNPNMEYKFYFNS